MTAPNITIRTDAPMPERKRTPPTGRKAIYPFDQLEVLHSFLVGYDELADEETNKKLRTRVSRAVTSANQKARRLGTGEFFQIRLEDGGVGVWRTK